MSPEDWSLGVKVTDLTSFDKAARTNHTSVARGNAIAPNTGTTNSPSIASLSDRETNDGNDKTTGQIETDPGIIVVCLNM